MSNYIYEKSSKSNDDIDDEEDSLFFGIAIGLEERLYVIFKALETGKMLTISNFMISLLTQTKKLPNIPMSI